MGVHESSTVEGIRIRPRSARPLVPEKQFVRFEALPLQSYDQIEIGKRGNELCD